MERQVLVRHGIVSGHNCRKCHVFGFAELEAASWFLCFGNELKRVLCIVDGELQLH